MESNAQANVKDLLGKFNKSYPSQQKFLNNLFSVLLGLNDNDIIDVLKTLLQLVESLEFPFVLLLNNDKYLADLMSLFFEDNFNYHAEKIYAKCIEKMAFEPKTDSSIKFLLDSAEAVGLKIEYVQRKEKSHLEDIYFTYSVLVNDCIAFKSFIENSVDYVEESNTIELVSRIKATITTKFNIGNVKYPIYILEFMQELTKNLSFYEDYFIKLLKESKSDISLNFYTPKENSDKPQIVDINKIDLRFRTSLYFDEYIQIDEGLNVEYKNYRWPLSKNLVETLQNQICGFLNSQGGRLYIGITDDKYVKGVLLKNKHRDLVRNEIANYTKNFYPKCRTNKLEVSFIPVKDKNGDTYLENIFVVKVIVKQGDTDKLYSVTSQGIKAYIRMPGQCVLLSAEETTEEIIKRKQSFKASIDEEQFIDPIPEKPLEVQKDKKKVDIDNYFKQFKENSNKKTNSRIETTDNQGNITNYFTLSIQNIPQRSLKKDVLNLFINTNYISEKIFTNKDGLCLGWGFLNFINKKDADNALKKLKGVVVDGGKLSIKPKY